MSQNYLNIKIKTMIEARRDDSHESKNSDYSY